jgi:hypothetical protein
MYCVAWLLNRSWQVFWDFGSFKVKKCSILIMAIKYKCFLDFNTKPVCFWDSSVWEEEGETRMTQDWKGVLFGVEWNSKGLPHTTAWAMAQRNNKSNNGIQANCCNNVIQQWFQFTLLQHYASTMTLIHIVATMCWNMRQTDRHGGAIRCSFISNKVWRTPKKVT